MGLRCFVTAYPKQKNNATNRSGHNMKNALTLSGLFAALSALPATAQEGLKAIGKPVDGLMGFGQGDHAFSC